MRKFLGVALILLFALVIILPSLIIQGLGRLRSPVEVETQERVVRLLDHTRGEVIALPLETYVAGVVAGEMPAEFEMEALKAQAVAARTYTLKKIEEARAKPDPKHPQADLCTDPTHCQAWVPQGALRQRYGFWQGLRYERKILQAVDATQGLVLTYQGELIIPVYHSNSGGRTESAEAVWGYDIPYLRSVLSPWDRESPRFRNTVTFTLAELDQKLGVNLSAVPAAALTPPRGQAIKVEEYTPTGRVKTIRIGDKTFKGTELRQLLGLSSTDFTWQVEGDRITFISVGNGHGVGLSQYGANGMAKEGKNFLDILYHYYRGVKVEKR
ncbi:MAG: stage II sporulation protein D [Thermanaeromonas sp.]|uniref:stage II sporulation protein D n=1 Tax=Thermanaeromonas sp. TaxID=2003697 RepID=UPI00243F36B7|nr:stage II sporulation protein D [Thermanaeromonas sp.]MCG0277877.1 stage II sporulation protein D [Thermanaeromonas sp.]